MNAQELLSIGLTNAALATLIAVAGWLLTRFWKNPHVASIVWLAVLLKLVTPPVVALPVVFDLDVERRGQSSGFDEQGVIANATAASLESTTEATTTITTPRQPVEAPKPAIATFPIDKPAGWASERVRDDLPIRKSSPLPVDDAPVNDELAAGIVAQHDDTASGEIASVLSTPAEHSWPWRTIGLTGWLVGTVLFGLISLVRIARFHHSLRRAASVDYEMQRTAEHVASRLRLKRCPAVRSVAANVGPMVWAGSLRPLVIVPRPLWDALGEHERETLLTHELAHVVRRDHWVRRFEAVVLILYWWLPTAWLAVRQREVAAETCCDALVLNHYPDRSQAYAEALLTAVTLLSTSRTPALASGLGRNHELKERLTMIVHDRVPKRPGRVVRWSMLLVATLALAVGANPEPEHAAQASDPAPPPSEPAPAVEVITRTPTVAVDEILFFHAEWALHAQQMKAVVEKLHKEGVPFRMIDVDREKELAKSMHVTSIPALVAMRNGKEIDRAVGAKTEDSLRAFVKRHPLADRGDRLSHDSRKKIIDGLIAVVQDEQQSGEVQAQAMRSLGNVAKGTDAAGRVESLLVETAEKTDDAEIKLGATDALNQLGSNKGVELLWMALETAEEPAALGNVVDLLDGTNAAPPSPKAMQVLAELSAGMADRGTGSRAHKALQILNRSVAHAEGLRRLIKAIETASKKDLSPRLRELRIEEMLERLPADRRELVREGLEARLPARGAFALREEKVSTHEVLLNLLAETQPASDEIAAVLLEALSHKDADIREAAAKALGNAESTMAGRSTGRRPARVGPFSATPAESTLADANDGPFAPAEPAPAKPVPTLSDDAVRKELLEPLIAAGKDEQATPESRIAALTALARLSKTKAEKEQAAEVVKAALEQVADETERRELSWLLFDLTDGRGGRSLVWPDSSSIPKEEAGRVIRELNARGIVPPDAEAVANLTKLTVLYGTKSGKRNGVRYESFHNETQAVLDRLTSRPEGIEKLVDAIAIAKEPSSQERGENAVSGDTPVRGMLLVHLSGIRPTSPEVAKVLAKALSHEDPAIRTAAATALGNYQPENKANGER